MASQITQAIEYIADFIAKKVLTKLISLDERLATLEKNRLNEQKRNYINGTFSVTYGTNSLKPDRSVLEAINTYRTLTISAYVRVSDNKNTALHWLNRAGMQVQVTYNDSSSEWLQAFTAESSYDGTLTNTLTIPTGKQVTDIDDVFLTANLPNASSVLVSNPRLVV